MTDNLSGGSRPSGFYARYAFLILLGFSFLFPVILVGSKKASDTNRNNVQDWLPSNFEETSQYKWFQRHFENETCVLVTWDGCTLDNSASPLELFARKIVATPGENPTPQQALFSKVITGPRLLDQLQQEPASLSREQALKRLEGLLVGPDHQQTCAVLSLSEAGKQDFHTTLDAIVDVAVNECAVKREAIHMGGPPVDNVAIDVEGQKTLRKLAVFSGIIGLVLSYVFTRHLGLTALIFFAGVYAACASLALVYYSHGKMDAIMYTMPSVVYCAALSGAIHILNYYRMAVSEGGYRSAAARALRRAWLPCFLSAATTAIGLFSLWPSDLVPIRNFGLYSGVGVMFTLVMLYLCVPSAVEVWPPTFRSRKAASPGKARWWNAFHWAIWPRIGEFVVRRPGTVIVAFSAVLAIFTFGVVRVQTSVNLMNMFSRDSDLIQQYTWLEDHLGGLVPMEVVVGFEQGRTQLDPSGQQEFLTRLELVQRVQREIVTIPDVASAMSALTFLPDLRRYEYSGDPAKMSRLFASQRNVLNNKLAQHKDELFKSDYCSLADISATGEAVSLELWRISIRLPALKDIDYGDFIKEIRAKVEPLLEAERERGVKGLEATYTGLTPVVYKAQRSLLNGLIESFVMAFFVMAAMMSIVYRNVLAGLLVMFPNVWPMALIFGTFGFTNWLVDIGTMMVASVCMGVSVDDACHFITWFRIGKSKGLTNKDAVREAYTNAAVAMSQSSFMVALGLVVFGLSSFVPTQRFGYFMLVGLMIGLFADLVLMPAITASFLGRFFCAGIRTAPRDTSGQMDEPASSRERLDPHQTVPLLRHDSPHRTVRT